VGITARGRVLRCTALGDHTIVTVDAPDGPHDLLVGAVPDHGAVAAATAGLWRLQWVQLHLGAEVPHARLAGTTRHPHVRTITVATALALAERGLPAFVVGEGD